MKTRRVFWAIAQDIASTTSCRTTTDSNNEEVYEASEVHYDEILVD